MRSSSLIAIAWAVASLLLVGIGHATEEDAKSFFAEGRRLRLAGDCRGAIVSFRRALDVYPEGLGSLRNVAECEEQLGEFASARNDWWALRRAALQTNEAKYSGWEKDAEAGYNRLASKVAHLTVKLEGDRLDRVRVTIDGKPLDPRLIGVELERDLGPHTIEAAYGGASPVAEKRSLSEGAREVVTLSIPLEKPERVLASRAPKPPSADRSWLKTGGFIALSVGAASLVAAGASLGVRQSALSTIEKQCPDYETKKCPARLSDDRDKGATAAALVNAFGIVGIVGVGAGATFLAIGYTRPSTTGAAPAAGRVNAFVLPGGAGAAARGTF